MVEDPIKSEDRSRSLTYLKTIAAKANSFADSVPIWGVSVRRGAWLVTESQSRNHEPSLSAAVHAVHRRLRPEEKTDLIMLVTRNCSLKRSQISRLLKEKNPDSISITKDISNAIAVVKRGMLDKLTNVGATAERLRNLNWRYSFCQWI